MALVDRKELCSFSVVSGSPLVTDSSLPNLQRSWTVLAYAPTNVSNEAAKDELYDQLHYTLRKVPDSGMLVLLRDLLLTSILVRSAPTSSCRRLVLMVV